MPTPAGELKKRPQIGEQGTFDPEELIGEFEGLFAIGPHGGPAMRRPTVLELENMLVSDGQTLGLETVVCNPIKAATFRIEETEGDKGEAELVRSVFLRSPQEGGMKTPTSLIIAQMCGAFARRRAFFEKVWTIRKDGALVYDKLAFRRASTCEILRDDKTKAYAGFKQRGYRDGRIYEKEFPPNKAFVYIHGSSSISPHQGQSVFETAYQNYLSKQKLMLLYFMYLQKFGIPPVVGQTDSGNLADQKAFLEKLKALRAGSYAVLGPGESLSTLNSAQTVGGSTGGSVDFREAFRYLDAQMAISMLVQFLMLGTGSNVGSWALSRDHSDLFLLSEEARQRELEDALTYDAIADLVYQNFGPNAVYPRFKFTALSQEHEAKAMDFLKALLSTGSAAPIDSAVLKLVLDKALANIDINQDAIAAAREALEKERGASSNGGSNGGGASDDALAAIRGLVGPTQAPPGGQGTPPSQPRQIAASEAAQEMAYDLGKLGWDRSAARRITTDDPELDEATLKSMESALIELGWTPAQTRDVFGRFGPSKIPQSDKSGATGGVKRGGAMGGGKAFQWPTGPGSKGGKPPGLSAAGKRPGSSSRVGDGVDEPDSLNKLVITKVPLDAGEIVFMQSRPPGGPHFVMVGSRSGAAYALFFSSVIQGRTLGEEDLGIIYESVTSAYDSGVTNYLGLFDSGVLQVETVSEPPPEEKEPMVKLLLDTYESTLQRLIVDGQDATPPQEEAAPEEQAVPPAGAPQEKQPPPKK